MQRSVRNVEKCILQAIVWSYNERITSLCNGVVLPSKPYKDTHQTYTWFFVVPVPSCPGLLVELRTSLMDP